MDISEYIREPMGAAGFAALMTVGYIFMKARLNNEPKPQTSDFVKPAILVGLLVYFIISSGAGKRESISVDPF